MPQFTIAEADAGVVGFRVVLAFRNVRTPVMPVAKPIKKIPTPSRVCAGNSKLNLGTARDTSHINAPITTITAGGGTFNSRTRMAPPHESPESGHQTRLHVTTEKRVGQTARVRPRRSGTPVLRDRFGAKT